MKKLIYSIFLAILFSISFQPAVRQAKAESEEPGGTENHDSDFVINAKGILTGYRGKDKTVIVPEGVVRIGARAFIGNQTIERIVLPDTVTSIGKEAFYNCSNLKVVEAGSLELLNEEAFYRCGVEEIDLSRVKKIEKSAFTGCNFARIDLSLVEEIGDDAFEKCDNLTEVIGLQNLKILGRAPFFRTPFAENYGKKNGEEPMLIINGILILAKNSKGTVVIPDTVTEIGGGAFAGNSLKKVIIPDSVVKIGDGAFMCSGLTSAVLPNSVKEIGNYAFAFTEALEYVSMKDSVTELGAGAFSSSSISDIRLSQQISELKEYTFERCYGLQNLTLPAALKKVDNSAMYSTLKLKTLTAPQEIAEQVQELIHIRWRRRIVYTTELNGETALEKAAKEAEATLAYWTVAELKLTTDRVFMGIGKRFSLRFNSGAKADKWRSDNKKVVEVDSVGNLYAMGTGTATITATIYGKDYFCEVIVK
ncbi:MAG: leucine-rich repeat domain-containing protein [Lachnospiraceae bacterium]|nr:leucine-rich repeat domain-containing protein [Lachnospiraceae bacterium]